MSNVTNLTKALLKAQTQMGAAVKDASNPFYKSKYADLPSVMEVVKVPLNSNGILVLQATAHKDGKNFINTSLIHAETGEALTSETEVICAKSNDPQAFGAAQTYARRFGLQSFLFIPAEDDDGNFASGKTTAKGQPVTTGGSTLPPNATVKDIQVTTALNHVTPAQTNTVVPLVSSSFSKKKNKPVEAAVAPIVPATVEGQARFE